ncbi:MAG: hypothetical protein M1457_10935 [bacterium]|nr:hypothetical protein [bacterium]
MRYGSIPVFGATLFSWSWFGRPVQWNGLRWAWSILRLAEVDDSYPWRAIAAGVTISAMYQQSTDAKDQCLWPDSIYTLNAEKSSWLFAPYQILKNVYEFLGYAAEPRIERVKLAEGSDGMASIAGCGRIDSARAEGGRLAFRFTTPPPLASRVLVIGVDRPVNVSLDGGPLPARESPPDEKTAGWNYDANSATLVIAPGRPGPAEIALAPARPHPCRLLVERAERIDFQFGESMKGWRLEHDLSDPAVRDGVLTLKVTGGDPYMTRGNCVIAAGPLGRVRVRMAVERADGTGNDMAQFYWATEQKPGFGESRVVVMPIQADGRMHDVDFAVGAHPLWRDARVTAIRLDPVNASGAVVRIDSIQGLP